MPGGGSVGSTSLSAPSRRFIPNGTEITIAESQPSPCWRERRSTAASLTSSTVPSLFAAESAAASSPATFTHGSRFGWISDSNAMSTFTVSSLPTSIGWRSESASPRRSSSW